MRYGFPWGDRDFARKFMIAMGLLALAILLWQVTDVVLLVFAAFLFSILLREIAFPFSRWLGASSNWALLFATIILILVVGGSVYLFGSEILAQVDELSRTLPQATEAVEREFGIRHLWSKAMDRMGDEGVLLSAAGWLGSLGAGLAYLGIILAGGLYIAAEPQIYHNGIMRLLPPSSRDVGRTTLEACGVSLRLWLLGQLFSMAVVGVLTTVGLYIIGLPSPLAIGLLAGLAEFVPLIGPVLAAIPALTLALSVGPETVLWTLGLYLVVQQIEGNILMPLVHRRTVELPPALTLFSVVAAGLIFGTLGVLLATPITVVVFVAVKILYLREGLGEEITLPAPVVEQTEVEVAEAATLEEERAQAERAEGRQRLRVGE